MSRYALFVSILLTAACGTGTDPEDDRDAGTARDAGYQGTPSQNIIVRAVLDGDTIVVSAGPAVRAPDGQPLDGERVRLLGIDAPEIMHDNTPADCWGDESSEFLRGRIGGRLVTLEYDPAKCRPPASVEGCRGDFGRLLAYVKYAGQTLNEESLLAGHSRTLGGGRFRHRDSDKYDSLQNQARGRDVGLWSCP